MAINNYIDLPEEGGSGAGVSSLNSLTGALTLVAGSGITITPSGSNITIAATGGGGGSGTVTSVSVVSANGLSGTVATATTTPAITLAPTFTGIAYSTGTALQAAIASNFPTLNQNTNGTAANITATSNSTITTLSSLSLPYSQVTGAPGGTVTSFSFTNGGGFTGTVTNSTTTPTLSLIGTLSGDITGSLTSTTLTATSNNTLTTLTALSLPSSQVTGLQGLIGAWVAIGI